MEAPYGNFCFADDCALATHSIEVIQCIMDCFPTACRHFSFKVNLSKTEAMYQPAPSKAPDALQLPPVVISVTEIKRVNRSCYLSSTNVQQWMPGCGSYSAHHKSQQCLGHPHTKTSKNVGSSCRQKIAVYWVVVLSVLLYGCKYGLCIVATSSSLSSSTSAACTTPVGSNGRTECPTYMSWRNMSFLALSVCLSAVSPGGPLMWSVWKIAEFQTCFCT